MSQMSPWVWLWCPCGWPAEHKTPLLYGSWGRGTVIAADRTSLGAAGALRYRVRVVCCPDPALPEELVSRQVRRIPSPPALDETAERLIGGSSRLPAGARIVCDGHYRRLAFNVIPCLPLVPSQVTAALVAVHERSDWGLGVSLMSMWGIHHT
jgi:hypothetical protein